jgi:hypothetical protein
MSRERLPSEWTGSCSCAPRGQGMKCGELVKDEVESQWGKHSSMLAWAVACALLVRLLVFAFAENKLADAPMRALLAEYRSSTSAAARDPSSFHQFGPLPIEIMRLLLALGGDVRVISRVPSLIAGLALLLPFIALARRMTRDGQVVVAATLALALSPLAVQLSTTAASESIYLLFWLACLERLHAAVAGNGQAGSEPPQADSDGTHGDTRRMLRQRRRDFLLAGMWASLAAVSRYDAWLAIPVAVAAVVAFGRRDLRLVVDLVLFVVAAAVLPAAYLLWLRAVGADPWAFARIISAEHLALAATLATRIGGLLARLHQVTVWVLGLAAAMTPIGLLGLPRVARRWRRLDGATRVVVAAAAAPMLLYLVKGLVLNDFAPQARFALVPGICLLPLALDALASRMNARTLQASAAAGALAFVAVVSVVAFGRRSASMGEAEALAPITRLDSDARAVATYLSTNRRPAESIFVDTLDYVDIVIAHAARVPLPLVATLWRTRALGDSLAEERSRTQATLFAAYDASWGSRPLRDWPATGVRFGGWRVARLE